MTCLLYLFVYMIAELMVLFYLEMLFHLFSNAGFKVLKQVAKKSTAQLPQKLATRDIQNGHVRPLQNAVHSGTLQSSNSNSYSGASYCDVEPVDCGKSDVADEDGTLHKAGATITNPEDDNTATVRSVPVNVVSSESCLSVESDDACSSAKTKDDRDVTHLTKKTASFQSDSDDIDGVVFFNDSQSADKQTHSPIGQSNRAKRPCDGIAETNACKKVRSEEPKDVSSSGRKTIVGRKVECT
jgi:hypothetical protein